MKCNLRTLLVCGAMAASLIVPGRAQQIVWTYEDTGSVGQVPATSTTSSANKTTKSQADTANDPKNMNTVAAAQPPQPSKSPIELRMGIPAWGSSISGDVGVNDVTGHINVGFKGLWQHLDGIAPLSADLRVNKLGFHVDGQWVKLGMNLNPRGTFIQSGSVEMQQAFANFNVNYRVVDTDMFTVDPFIGGRYQYMSLHGTLESARPRLIPNVDATGSVNWADPILGVEARVRVMKPLSLAFYGDVGGFGVSSHLTDQIYGGIDLQVTRCLFMDVGYRYLHTNFTSSDAVCNIDMYGPQLTFGLKF